MCRPQQGALAFAYEDCFSKVCTENAVFCMSYKVLQSALPVWNNKFTEVRVQLDRVSVTSRGSLFLHRGHCSKAGHSSNISSRSLSGLSNFFSGIKSSYPSFLFHSKFISKLFNKVVVMRLMTSFYGEAFSDATPASTEILFVLPNFPGLAGSL